MIQNLLSANEEKTRDEKICFMSMKSCPEVINLPYVNTYQS
jgi:hypothetical protein